MANTLPSEDTSQTPANAILERFYPRRNRSSTPAALKHFGTAEDIHNLQLPDKPDDIYELAEEFLGDNCGICGRTWSDCDCLREYDREISTLNGPDVSYCLACMSWANTCQCKATVKIAGSAAFRNVGCAPGIMDYSSDEGSDENDVDDKEERYEKQHQFLTKLHSILTNAVDSAVPVKDTRTRKFTRRRSFSDRTWPSEDALSEAEDVNPKRAPAIEVEKAAKLPPPDKPPLPATEGRPSSTTIQQDVRPPGATSPQGQSVAVKSFSKLASRYHIHQDPSTGKLMVGPTNPTTSVSVDNKSDSHRD